MAKPKHVDDYLRSLPEDRRAALQRLREQIRRVVPDAEECISYSMPAFRVPGGVVAGFQSTRSGCSYYPFSGSTLTTLAEAIERYDHTRSALHFPAEKGLPRALVRKLVQARLAEIAQSARSRAKPRARSLTTRAAADPGSRPARRTRWPYR